MESEILEEDGIQSKVVPNSPRQNRSQSPRGNIREMYHLESPGTPVRFGFEGKFFW
jgi:hypothetical protein